MSFNDISTYLKQFSRDIKVHGLPRWLGSRESAYNAGGTGNIGSMKEESEKVGLKLNIQKAKIVASGPITS